MRPRFSFGTGDDESHHAYVVQNRRVQCEGHAHDGIELRFGGVSHRVDFKSLVGESTWLYPQTDVFIDLANARERDDGDVRFGISDTEVLDVTTDRPTIRFTDADLRGA